MSAKFLETADRLGARICRDAIWAGGRCNWIGGYTESASTIVHRASADRLRRAEATLSFPGRMIPGESSLG